MPAGSAAGIFTVPDLARATRNSSDVTVAATILRIAHERRRFRRNHNDSGAGEPLQVADVDIDANGNGIYRRRRHAYRRQRRRNITTADFFADDHSGATYDDEMLNSHFVTGDGRGNENIALTAFTRSSTPNTTAWLRSTRRRSWRIRRPRLF